MNSFLSLSLYNYIAGPANQDFIPGTRVVEFDPRTPSEEVCASFTATDDNIIFETFAEADEFFVVTLISSDNVDVIREDSIAHVVIEDNDGMYVCTCIPTKKQMPYSCPIQLLPCDLCRILLCLCTQLQNN